MSNRLLLRVTIGTNVSNGLLQSYYGTNESNRLILSVTIGANVSNRLLLRVISGTMCQIDYY